VLEVYSQYPQFPFFHTLINEITPFYEEAKKREELSIEIPSE
jgi:hypothetical protein